MNVSKRLTIQFAALFVAMSGLAAAQNNNEGSFEKAGQLLTGLGLGDAKEISPSDFEGAPGAAQAPGAIVGQLPDGTTSSQISDTERSQYNFQRAALRIDRTQRFAQYRRELLNLGLSSDPSPIETADVGYDKMFAPQLKVIFDSKEAELRSTEAGSEDYVSAVRELALVSYYYTWALLDADQFEQARSVEKLVDETLAPYIEAPPPSLVLPIVRHYRLKSQFARRAGNVLEQERMMKESFSRIDKLDVYPPDYLALARLKARGLLNDTENAQESREEACKIFDSVVALRPVDPTSLRGFIDCHIAMAEALIAKQGSDLREGIARLEVTREYLAKFQKKNPDAGPEAGIFELMVINSLAKNEQSPPYTKSSDEYKRLSARHFAEVLQGVRYRQNSYWELSDIYYGFADLKPEASAKSPRPKSELRDASELLLAVADAIEPSQLENPGAPSFALIAADSLARASQFMLDRQDIAGADTASSRAESVLDKTGVIRALSSVDERAEAECLVRNRRVRVLIEQQRTDDALAAFRKFDATCGDWVRKYPWEFYARQYATDINDRLGVHLGSKGRFAEALPLLTYASNWGVKSSTTKLAGIYTDPAGAFFDPVKAKQLEVLAERQSLKRFTVPTDFNGVKYPFHVYVAEYGPGTLCKFQAEPLDPAEACVGYEGIDDQVIWLEVLRGGKVPQDVTISFRKLFKIARENNVSLPDLAVYALDAASKPEIAATDGQVAAIHEEMKVKKFARSPDRWLDPAGIALGGHDAISYRQGSAPVLGSAEFYTLWDGALWLFKDAANRDLFNSDPNRFAPQYGGFSAWEVIDQDANAGEPAIFALVDDKLFMFDAEKHVADWKADAANKIAKADEAWFGMEPTGTAAATTLADRILKLGPVRLADRGKFYVEGCQQNRGDQCDRLFRLARKECIQDDAIPACNLAIVFAEGMEDKSVLVSLLGNRSWEYAQVNKPDEAIADAERALAIDPNQPWIHGNLANGLLMKGQVERAIAIYREQKDRPGPGQEGTMCKVILEDVDKMLAAKVLGEAAGAEVRRAIVCP